LLLFIADLLKFRAALALAYLMAKAAWSQDLALLQEHQQKQVS